MADIFGDYKKNSFKLMSVSPKKTFVPFSSQMDNAGSLPALNNPRKSMQSFGVTPNNEKSLNDHNLTSRFTQSYTQSGMFKDTSIEAASIALKRDASRSRFCDKISKSLKRKNKPKRNHFLKYGRYQTSIKSSCFAMKPAKNNLFLEKIQKTQFIEKLAVKHPGVTPKKNWVFLPEAVIKEKFMKASHKIVQEEAANKIQSYWKVYLIRREFLAYKNKLKSIAKRFQLSFRKWKLNKQKQSHYLKAIVKIQSCWRGYLVRRQTVNWCYSKIYNQLDAFKNLREKYLLEEIKYYCNLWKEKVKDNKFERRLHARKAFVYYAITVYEKLKKKKSLKRPIHHIKAIKPKPKKSISKPTSKKQSKLLRSKKNVNKFQNVVRSAIKNKTHLKNILKFGGKLTDKPSSPLVKSKTFQGAIVNKALGKIVNKSKITPTSKSRFNNKIKRSSLSGIVPSRSHKRRSKYITAIIKEETKIDEDRSQSADTKYDGIESPEIRVVSSFDPFSRHHLNACDSAENDNNIIISGRDQESKETESIATTDDNLDDLASKSESD
ncbi:unnamed protein product [Moneuplotes crassus]|uniref:Uncharacterized protein n=1 Tax=Euplotes crassus TaxID=5936 RepID=A0AAD2DBI4_EUPCR|nr:unnamed protein product [Moneuplotes crassus]